jgi:hypothetical protein
LPVEVELAGEVEIVEISLTGMDMLPEDDNAILSNIAPFVVDVALVADNYDPIDRAFAAIPGVDLTLIRPEDYDPDYDFDLVVFRGYIPSRWPTGTVIVFDLPEGENKFIKIEGLKQISSSSSVETARHKILERVELSGVRWELVREISDDWDGRELVWSGELPILLNEVFEEREIFYLLPPLSSGNFTKHPAFPLFLAGVVDYSRNFTLQPDYLIGDRMSFAVEQRLQEITLQTPSGREIDENKSEELFFKELGLHTLEITDLNGQKSIHKFGVNAGEIGESNISPKEWRSLFAAGDEAVDIGLQYIEIDLSPWLLIVVVVMLVLEAWRAWR